MTDDLVKRLRTDAEAYRQSIAAPTSHDMFTLAYQWQDKKHRHVWDLCSRIETAADRIERLEVALQNLVDAQGDDECWRDHHGYCQAHYLEEDCCVAEARKALEGKDD